MSESMIQIAKDFSRFPGGRFRTDGPHSGEAFREQFLVPALRESDNVTVVLDGVAGLPASFLEEAFGGLVRTGFRPGELSRKLHIVATTPRLRRYPDLVWNYVSVAADALKRAV